MNDAIASATSACAARAITTLLTPSAPWIIACSGGSDSMALVALAVGWAQAGLLQPPTLIHVHHHLRPDADADAALVADTAGRLNLPVQVLHLDPDAIHAHPDGLEAGARALRYDALVGAANALNISSIATAHHARDHLETLLMRLGEGTGVAGMGGPAAERYWQGVRLIRPLLDCWPDELAAVRLATNLSAVEDPTNADTRFRRNAIRLRLLPLLEALLPREPLRRSLRQLREDAALMEELLRERMQRVVVAQSGSITVLSRSALRALPDSERRAVLLRWLRQTSHGRIDARFVTDTASRLMHPGPAIMLGNRTRVEMDRQHVVIGATDDPRAPLDPDAVAALAAQKSVQTTGR